MKITYEFADGTKSEGEVAVMGKYILRIILFTLQNVTVQSKWRVLLNATPSIFNAMLSI